MPSGWVRVTFANRSAAVRYALDTGKLQGLGWSPQVTFDEGLRRTVEWYKGQHQPVVARAAQL